MIGLLKVTRAVLPNMRANRAGTIVNISSIGGQISFPLGIRVRIVRPGMIRTDFGGRSFDFAMDKALSDYAPTAQAMGRLCAKFASEPSAPKVVADAIWQAANEPGNRLRFRAGPEAEALLEQRKQQDDASFIGGLKALMAE